MADSKSESDIDVENLKVIDIKKRLKAMGLPVTGNKPELVERLQLALMSGRDAAASPDSACDSSPSKSKDQAAEDMQASSEAMFEEGQDLDQSSEVGQSHGEKEEASQSQYFTPPGDDIDESKDQESGQVARESAAVSTSVPLKKRALPDGNAETDKPRKKIILKRNNIPTRVVIPPKNEKSDIGEAVVSQSCDVATDPIGTGKNVVKLSNTNKISEAEKAANRAIRFCMTGEQLMEKSISQIDRDKNFAEVLRRSQANKKKPVARAKMNTDVPVLNLDVLKKRAERFGENVSSLLKKVEVQEKLNQRQLKFGGSGVPTPKISISSGDPAEEEKKRKRAERFGKY